MVMDTAEGTVLSSLPGSPCAISAEEGAAEGPGGRAEARGEACILTGIFFSLLPRPPFPSPGLVVDNPIPALSERGMEGETEKSRGLSGSCLSPG